MKPKRFSFTPVARKNLDPKAHAREGEKQFAQHHGPC